MTLSITLRMLPLAVPALALNLLPGSGWFSLFVRIGLYTAIYLPYAWRFLLEAREKEMLGGIVRRLRRH